MKRVVFCDEIMNLNSIFSVVHWWYIYYSIGFFNRGVLSVIVFWLINDKRNKPEREGSKSKTSEDKKRPIKNIWFFYPSWGRHCQGCQRHIITETIVIFPRFHYHHHINILQHQLFKPLSTTMLMQTNIIFTSFFEALKNLEGRELVFDVVISKIFHLLINSFRSFENILKINIYNLLLCYWYKIVLNQLPHVSRTEWILSFQTQMR